MALTLTRDAPLRLHFVMSAIDVGALPAVRAEVAVIGRSNVGKSSLINALAARKNLARVSNTPGRTQTLNLYQVDATATMVDLPGYGYAAASHQTRSLLSKMIDSYLRQRQPLVMVIVLVDGRIGPTELDVGMLGWLRERDLAYSVVATKHDKIRPSKRPGRQQALAVGCGLDPAQVRWVSAAKGTGVAELRQQVLGWLGPAVKVAQR